MTHSEIHVCLEQVISTDPYLQRELSAQRKCRGVGKKDGDEIDDRELLGVWDTCSWRCAELIARNLRPQLPVEDIHRDIVEWRNYSFEHMVSRT
ncbi:MAG: hypothetical protein WDZ82_01975 [Candidatus Paceibacterota bacterium]